MKILHTADWHIGKLLEGKSRLQEQEMVLEQFVRIADETQADVVCIAGDIFDNGHPSAGAEALLYRTLKDLTAQGDRLVVMIAGNHDQPSRLEAIAPLVREHGIILYGTPQTRIASGFYGHFEITSLDACTFSFSHKGEKAVFVCVPYLSEKSLNEVLYQAGEEEEKKAQDYARKVGAFFKEKARWYQEDTINLLMSHVFTLGSIKDGSEQGMVLGNSYLLPPEVFPPAVQYAALGHIHRPQKAVGSQGRIRYSGSILPYRLQETVIAKQCCLAELHPRQPVQVREIYLDNPKPIEKWVCQSYEEALEKCRENQNRPCYVYLQIYTETYIREEQLKELKKYKDDILEVLPLFPEQQAEQNMERFAEKSFEELFLGYYLEKKGTQPEQEVLDMLRDILEKEVQPYATNQDEAERT